MGEPSDFDGSVMKREPSPDEPEGRIRFRVAGIQSGPRNQLATEPQYKRETSSDHSRSPEDHIGALIHGGVVEPRFIRRVKADVAVLPIDDATPREVFAHTLEGRPLRDSFHATGLERMVRYEQPDEILVYTSGQTIRKNRGNTGARLSGCAIIFGREDLRGTPRFEQFSLEGRTLGRSKLKHNDVCAALRAVVAALEIKTWGSEGWKRVTIATDHKTIHDALTQHIARWVAEGHLHEKAFHSFAHRDLYRRALDLINEQTYRECEVSFWLITEEQNQEAIELARAIAPHASKVRDYQSRGDVQMTFKEA
jgi:ribonuclease HI